MKYRPVWIFLIPLLLATGCTRSRTADRVIVEIPEGFSGNFVLNMGVKNAEPLAREGDHYLITVPKSGDLSTSSLLTNPQLMFRNSSDGSVWGYSHSVFTTGDGIPVGGKIEFFVGTKKDYDAEENKKKQSGRFMNPELLEAQL